MPGYGESPFLCKTATEDWVELEKPVRAEWEKEFDLRAGVAARKDADRFREILERINQSIRSHRKDFRYRTRSKRYEYAEPELKIIKHSEWDLPEFQKKHFDFGEFEVLRDAAGRSVDQRFRERIVQRQLELPFRGAKKPLPESMFR